MVKLKISSTLFFLSLCSVSILPACTFNGPHKPVEAGGTVGKPDGGGSGGSDGGEKGNSIVTYADVKSIFETRCATCHLRDHKWTLEQSTAESKREVVRNRVEGRTMPMVGSEESKAITDLERQKIVAWAKGESLGGNKPTKGNAGTSTPAPGGNGSGSSPATPSNPSTPGANQAKALIQRCQACHGEQGLSVGEGIPNLAGSDADYLLARVFYFSRPDAVGTMMPEQIKALAKEFSLKDEKDKVTMDLLKGVVDFFSQSKSPVTAAEKKAAREKLSRADLAKYARGQQIVSDGNCVMCHMVDGKPGAGIPNIFSQRAEYILSRFKDFQDRSVDDTPGKRTNDQTMPGILENLKTDLKLTDLNTELEAVALYLNLTAPEEAVPAAAK